MQTSEAPSAADTLQAIARDEKLTASLRHGAIDGLVRFPSAIDQLKRWAISNDKVLSPGAKASMERAGMPVGKD